MQLVEQHVIARGDQRFAALDAAAFQAKNLYNAALCLVRQACIFEHRSLGYQAVYHQMKRYEAYRALPRKVAQQVLRLLDQNWRSYFAATSAYQEDPSRFRTHPKLPHYKHKTQGRSILIYTPQTLSRPGLKAGLIRPSGLPSPFGPNRPTSPRSVSCLGSDSTWWRWSMRAPKHRSLAIPHSMLRSILALTIWPR